MCLLDKMLMLLQKEPSPYYKGEGAVDLCWPPIRMERVGMGEQKVNETNDCFYFVSAWGMGTGNLLLLTVSLHHLPRMGTVA